MKTTAPQPASPQSTPVPEKEPVDIRVARGIDRLSSRYNRHFHKCKTPVEPVGEAAGSLGHAVAGGGVYHNMGYYIAYNTVMVVPETVCALTSALKAPFSNGH